MVEEENLQGQLLILDNNSRPLYTLCVYTLYPHHYFCLFLGLSHQKHPGLHFLCIFLIISWAYCYTVRMSTFENYQCACNDCLAATKSNLQIWSFLRMSRRVWRLCNLPNPTVTLAKCSFPTEERAFHGPSEGWDRVSV